MSTSAKMLCLLAWLAPAVAWAAPEPVVLHIVPGAVEVHVGTDPEQGLVCRGTNGAEGVCRWIAESGAANQYVLRRPPFDPMEVSLEWNDQAGAWMVLSHGQSVRLSDCKFQLTRTIEIAADPSGYEVYAVERPSVSTVPLTVEGGQVVTALRLPHQAKGYTIPLAWQPPALYVVHSGFEPVLLQFGEGELDTAQKVFPIPALKLRPLYGPFSYWQFNTALGAVLLGALGGVLGRAQSRRRLLKSIEAMAAWMRRPTTFTRGGKAKTWAGWSQDQATRAVADLTTVPQVHGLVGQVLTSDGQDEFRIVGTLGQGAMGEVFDAVRVANEAEHVAIKVLRKDVQQPEAASRFHRELQICAALKHPAIVRVLDWGTTPLGDSIHPFIVFERVEGETMAIAARRIKAVASRQAAVIRWSIDVLQGLQAAHAEGIVHRDLKPDNIMITQDSHARLLDFGLARAVEWEPLTRAGSAMGTPKYMSPEHFKAASVVPASDIYSLGVTMYEAMCGEVPWEGVPDWQLVQKITRDQPPSLKDRVPGINPELARIVMRMIAGYVPPRQATAGEVLKDLIPLAED